jgi:peptidoglycan/LPS O-acetylase OafA/YrhL
MTAPYEPSSRLAVPAPAVAPGLAGLEQIEGAESPSSPSSVLRLDAQFPALDGIRGLAVLLITVLHFTAVLHPVTPTERLFVAIRSFGWVGVDLFFVLSGFLITGILWDSKGSQHFFRNFYVRRVLRIFPLYYGFLFAFFVLAPAIHPTLHLLLAYKALEHDQWWFWTYLQNVLWARQHSTAGVIGHELVGHLWSLAVEEQFYLVWPMVVFLCSRRVLTRVCAVCVAAALLLRITVLLRVGGPSLANYILTPARMDQLAAGAWLAVILSVPGNYARVRRWAWPTVWVAGGGFLLASLPDLLTDGRSTMLWGVQSVGFTLLAAMFGALIVLAIDPRPSHNAPNRLFQHPLLVFFGKYSYGIYVLHLPIRFALERAGLDARTLPLAGHSLVLGAMGFWCVGIVLTTIAAFVSWHLFEKHFLHLKRLFPRHG